MSWTDIVKQSQLRDYTARVPFCIGHQTVGSVARQHLPALAAWPDWLRLHEDAVVLTSADATGALAVINTTLRDQGLLRGWRNEIYAVTGLDGGATLACIERAAARFWGTLTQGAHATGYVADASGAPTHLWIGRRALNKATDPGKLDNLVGGGVPEGQTPWQALLREGFEEAGLSADTMAGARPGRVIRLHRDVAEGLQLEDIHSHDLLLPPGLEPMNQDGEVAGFECLPVLQALARAEAGEMTVDAALVTLDFALRHGLFTAPEGALRLMRSA